MTAATEKDYEDCIRSAQEAFVDWRMVPAPQKGEIVEQFGDARAKKKI